jgi:hypothetical protein
MFEECSLQWLDLPWHKQVYKVFKLLLEKQLKWGHKFAECSQTKCYFPICSATKLARRGSQRWRDLSPWCLPKGPSSNQSTPKMAANIEPFCTIVHTVGIKTGFLLCMSLVCKSSNPAIRSVFIGLPRLCSYAGPKDENRSYKQHRKR